MPKGRKTGTIRTVAQAMNIPAGSEQGTRIRAEFAKRGWKVGDVARMLGVHQPSISASINSRRRLSRCRSTEEGIAGLLGFNPFPPLAPPMWNARLPLSIELQQAMGMSLIAIAKLFDVPPGSLASVAFGERSSRGEAVIERILGRELHPLPVSHSPHKATNHVTILLRSLGFSHVILAKEFGVTRQYVELVCRFGPADHRIAKRIAEIIGFNPFPERKHAGKMRLSPGVLFQRKMEEWDRLARSPPRRTGRLVLYPMILLQRRARKSA